MPTRTEIADDLYAAQQFQIRRERPDATPWPDGTLLGSDDGAGYGFSILTVRAFTAAIYKILRIHPPYASLKVPAAMPADDFLGGDLLAHRRWIAHDVAHQLAVL